MVKIPTYTARTDITDKTPSVESGIKVNPNTGIASALLPTVKQIDKFFVKKRDLAEKTEADKKIFEMKGELDKYVISEKENINEDNAINNFKLKYNTYVKDQLSSITNNRIKEKVTQGLNLEFGKYVYNLKKNSYAALEANATENINNDITSLSSKYATSTDVELKQIYKSEAEEKIRNFVKDFELPQNVLDKKLKALDKKFLTSDFQQFAGTPNGLEAIKFADNAYGGEKTLSNLEFSNAVLESYKTAISEITVVGDENANFDKAQALIDELKDVERSNGFKINFGETAKKLDDLEQKIITEKIQHENRIDQVNQGRVLLDYSNDQKNIIRRSFTNDFGQLSGTESTRKALEAENEFDVRFDKYLKLNSDASLEEKQDYAREIALILIDKYQDTDIEELTTFNLERNKFDLVSEKKQIITNMKAFQLFTSNPKAFSDDVRFSIDNVNAIKTRAKLNGYVDEKGEGDVNAFFNRFIEILNNRNPE
tara:strand:+ start:1010 stop:2464 length:1455 start_codon:yes stop_codon:yes gene_type:complete